MKDIIFILFTLIITFFSCTNKEKNDKLNIKSTFDLKQDLLEFSTKMSESDTIYFSANLSVCEYRGYEENIITKKDGVVYIKTFADGDFMPNEEKELRKIAYNFLPKDTLNFENLFHYMQLKDVNDEPGNSVVFTIICEKDTVRFYSSSLGDHLHNLEYYMLIKRRLYPNANNYKPTVFPEKDIVDQDQNIKENNFSRAINKLSQLKYYKVQNFSDCESLIDNGYCAIINPDKHSIKYIKDFEIIEHDSDTKLVDSSASFEIEYIYPIKIDNSVIIKQYRLEKEHPSMSPSLRIEEWSFSNDSLLQDAIMQLNAISEYEWFQINKSSVSWWKKENRLYFILPNETYVKYDMPQIRQILENNL